MFNYFIDCTILYLSNSFSNFQTVELRIYIEKREVKKKISSEEVKKEIKENYKIGIEYYEDVEEHQD